MAQTTDTARRLTETELEAWAGLLRVHATITHALDAELQNDCGISLSDYDVLVHLANAAEQRLRMSELAESVLISQSGITRLIDRLVTRGMVERVRCDEDRRGAFAALTPAGLDVLRRASPAHVASIRERFLNRLTAKEQETLARTWQRVLPDVTQTFRRLRRPER